MHRIQKYQLIWGQKYKVIVIQFTFTQQIRIILQTLNYINLLSKQDLILALLTFYLIFNYLSFKPPILYFHRSLIDHQTFIAHHCNYICHQIQKCYILFKFYLLR